MILIDDTNTAHTRNPDGSWRRATAEELDFAGVNAEGYMAGWYNGAMCASTAALILIVVIAWLQTYTGASY